MDQATFLFDVFLPSLQVNTVHAFRKVLYKFVFIFKI